MSLRINCLTENFHIIALDATTHVPYALKLPNFGPHGISRIQLPSESKGNRIGYRWLRTVVSFALVVVVSFISHAPSPGELKKKRQQVSSLPIRYIYVRSDLSTTCCTMCSLSLLFARDKITVTHMRAETHTLHAH